MGMCDILIVEDSSNLRNSIREALEVHGYTVEARSNGLQAKEFLEFTIPPLIICDVVMPEFDGKQLLEYVQKNVDPVPSFLFISSFYQKDWQNLGATGFLMKPFSMPALIQTVRNVLISSNT